MPVTVPVHPRAVLLALALAATVLTPIVSRAQDAASDIKVPDVVVTAARGTSLDRLDVSTTVVTRQEIERSPETTVDQILNKVPGIFIPAQPTNQLHPTGQELSMRGFGSSTNELVLVLVDGVPANDPYFRTVNWTQIPKGSIERIEIIRGGGATSLWGNLAMGGVINIVTREPQNGHGTADISYGSFNTFTGDASAGYAPNDKIKFGLTYDGIHSDGYNQTPSQFRAPTMGSTGSISNVVTASTYLTPDPDSKYFLKFLFSDLHESGLIYDLANNDWLTYRFTAGGTTQITPGIAINTAAWYQGNTFKTTNASDAAYTLSNPSSSKPYYSLTEDARYPSAGASVFVQSGYGPIRDIKIGIDYRTIWVNDPVDLYNASEAQTGQLTAKANHQFEGLFAQGTYRPDPIPLDITLGLREDLWQARDASISGGATGAAQAVQTLPGTSATHFDPRLGLKYYFDSGIDLRGAVYENFSAPGMNQMYRNFVTGSNYTIANPGLRPQTNFGGEVGIDYKGNDVDVSLTGYQNALSDYIDLLRLTGQSCASAAYSGLPGCVGLATPSSRNIREYANVGSATLRGFELFGDWRATQRLTLDAGFSLTNAFLTESTDPADPVHKQLGQVPPWVFTAGVNWQPFDALTVTVQFRGFPEFWQYTNHATQQPNQPAFTADARVAYRFTEHLEVYLAIQNLTNVQYYDQGALTPGTPPELAMPFSATGGLHATF